jgi:hypothetical protein
LPTTTRPATPATATSGEYSRATKGLAAVRWSRGLRVVILGQAADPEKTDAQLAAEDISGELVTIIPLAVWSHLRLAGLDHTLLVAAEQGGLAAVSTLTDQVGCRQPPGMAVWTSLPVKCWT